MRTEFIVFFCALSLMGCEASNSWELASSGDGTANVGMQPPSFLTDARMVDPNNLVLDVLANGMTVAMVPDEQGVWRGQLNFDPDQSVTVVAAWSEAGSPIISLASAQRTVDVPDDPAGIVVPMEDRRFKTNFDADGDLRSNIAELRAGTDPRMGTSTPPQRLPVKINFGIPASLQNQPESVINALSLTVLVNDRVFSVTRNGNVWSGEGTEVAGNDVFIDAKFYANSARDNLLDRYELRHSMESNGVFLGLDTSGPQPTP